MTIPPITDRALAIHDRAVVWDAHCDSLQRAVIDGVDLGVASSAQADLPAWKAGGVRAQVFAVWIDTIYAPDHAARRAFQQIAAFYQLLAKYPDQVELALTGADVRRIAGSGRLAAMLAMEGGVAIQNDLGLLRAYAQLGATSMTLTHSASIDWVDSSTDVERWGGLNDFGREVLAEMGRLRMIVDLSHVSDKTIEQAVKVVKGPLIASHSSARALVRHNRNLPDHLAKAIADTGGCIGVNFYSEFIDEATREANASKVGLLAALNQPSSYRPDQMDQAAADRLRGAYFEHASRPPFERIFEMIDYLVNIAGIDHVGIGADLDSVVLPVPLGIDSVRDYPRITEGLIQRGYSEGDIEKIMGGNFLRVFAEVRGG